MLYITNRSVVLRYDLSMVLDELETGDQSGCLFCLSFNYDFSENMPASGFGPLNWPTGMSL